MADSHGDRAALPAATAIGRVGIRAAGVDRLIPFYRDAVGCTVRRAAADARLAAGDGRELLRLIDDPDAEHRPRSAAGLFHVAIRLPDRPGLADALARLRGVGANLTGASDHLVSEALYLRDPADNGVELYRDRPRESWTRPAAGRVEMDTLPLDLEDLATSGSGSPVDTLPGGTDIGHVHLEVTDLEAATRFYREGVGLAVTSDAYPGARFLAAGGYHHHVGLNVWNRRSSPAADHQGIEWFELVLPDRDSRRATVSRLTDQGYPVDHPAEPAPPVVRDPDGIEVRLVVDG